MKKVVILGAGYAGVLTAKKLAKQVKKRKLEDVEITVVDKNPFHTMLTELHEVAAQRVEEDSVRISLKKVFAGRKVRVVQDTVTELDFERQTVAGGLGALPYDYLVLSSGSKPTYFGTPGAEEYSFTLWSYDDAIRLREHIMDMFRAAEAETDPERKRALLTFYVVGLGFTGVEMMGELAELVPSLCGRFELDPSLVALVDVDMLERACTVMPERLGEKVVRRLEKMGVDVRFKTYIKGVGEDYIEFDRGNGLEREKTHTVIWTAGVEGSDAAQASKDLGAAGRGRVQTDEFLCAANYKNVYVGGDNIYYIPEGESAPVPQMVEVAETSADTIAHNLMTDLTGTGEKEKFAPKFHGVMVCVGGRYGAAYVGTVNHKLALASFLAMFAKHFVNVIYFVKVLGWHKVYSYLRHEFFTVRGKRSFVGGHFSNRGPSFFLAPLRIFLGAYWLYESISKMVQGWMSSAQLQSAVNGAAAWFDSMIKGAGNAASAVASATTAASTATDAVASATGGGGGGAVTETANNVILNWNLWLMHPILIGGGSAHEVAFRLKVPVLDWFLGLLLPNDTMQMIMQITIVLLEVLIGLALMGGLFTTPAGVGSIVLQLMFLTTTGLYLDTWWMLAASVAVLFGAGRVFSLDYYVQPWLKKHWNRTRLARKSYLYHD